MPEFDMPGHATSWRESHPEIFSSGAPSTCGSPVDGRYVQSALLGEKVEDSDMFRVLLGAIAYTMILYTNTRCVLSRFILFYASLAPPAFECGAKL